MGQRMVRKTKESYRILKPKLVIRLLCANDQFGLKTIQPHGPFHVAESFLPLCRYMCLLPWAHAAAATTAVVAATAAKSAATAIVASLLAAKQVQTV